MAYSYIWPPALPQNPQENFSETGGVLLLRTPQDKGAAKQRRIGKRINTMQCTFHMRTSQVEALRVFVEDTIKGTARFGFPHPRTGAIVEARIVASDNGEMYQVSYTMNNVWNVSMQLEILP